MLTSLRDIKRELMWRFRFDTMILGAFPAHDPKLADVYTERGIAFIHIPKSAGTSVERALYTHSVKHRHWQEIKALDEEAWEKWLKIAVIREPVDRFISAFDYLSKGGRNEYDARFGKHIIAGQSINDFIQSFEDPAKRARIMSFLHFQTQASYVMDGDTLVIDALIPLERLSNDLPKIADLPEGSIPHDNPTKGKRTTTADISEHALQILHKYYAADFKLYDIALRQSDDRNANMSN